MNIKKYSKNLVGMIAVNFYYPTILHINLIMTISDV